MPLTRLAIFTILAMIHHHLLAQSAPHGYAYSVGASVFKGFILKHNEDVGHIAVSHPKGISFFLNKHTFGKKYCEQLYNYPDIGLSLSYFDYENTVLGKSFAASTYLAIPVKRFDQSEISFKLGTGLAYHTNPHDLTHNNSNYALGTPLTLTMLAGLKYARQLSDLWWGGLSLTLTHFSNGAYSKPNSGINVPALDFEVSRKIKPVAVEPILWSGNRPNYVGIKYFFGASSGVREVEYAGDKFVFFNFHFQASRRFNAISAVNLGMDGFFNNFFNPYVQEEEIGTGPVRLGLVAGHELFYDRISLLTQIGYYMYHPTKKNVLYQRYGLRYAWTQHFLTSVMLKAHGGQAEFIEWGIGLKF